ncbi:gibberellin 2-oxidase [Medicago truncatula]|uniref:Gibberellin 2-oxidase n=1 Tax=Medicago truncatula TaxID=3880 RepID=G7IVV8_MEDTR|nr:gibberellin 2-oxidase [Medicago truncatula]
MVLASPKPMRNETILPNDLIPIVDLKSERSEVIKQIVKASEEYGFFKVINHGISDGTIEKMEEAGFSFFAKPMSQKKQAAPAYGCKNIGFNGDIGEVEYLLLNANTSSIAQISKTISNDDPHSNFRNVMKTTSLLRYKYEYCKGLKNDILRSNDVSGLQISLQHGLWIPVNPDPEALCVNIGDVLEVFFFSYSYKYVLIERQNKISYLYAFK